MQIEHRMDAKRGNLIWLSDGWTEAAAALDFGIRIVHLSCAGKPNLFYSQPDDLSDGLATEAGWRIYGGHRFWSSPESTRCRIPSSLTYFWAVSSICWTGLSWTARWAPS